MHLLGDGFAGQRRLLQRDASTGSKTISSPAANRKTGSRPGA
jgi:hypothetical protein